MATQYFRVTAYYPKEDLTVIIDSNGMFEKLWQLSSFILQKGLKIIEASSDEKFIDINIEKAEADTEHIILRAEAKDKHEPVTQTIDGVAYQAIKVADKIYIPDRDKRL
jgi:hypothetical protein